MPSDNYKIKMLGLNPTYKCNLNCYMCGQRKMEQTNISRELEIETIKRIILECKKHGLAYGVYIWGGEPFLYSKIRELLTFLNENKIFMTINTNGTMLDKYMDVLLNNNNYCRLIISIDGLNDDHDEIRGIKGTYSKVVKNIEYLKANKNKNLIVSTNTVVTSINYNKLFEIISGISELGVDYMECQLPIYFTDECGKKYEERMKQCLQILAKRWEGFKGSYSDIDVKELIQQVNLIREKFGKRFKLAPNLKEGQIETYFKEPDSIQPDKICSLPFSQLHLEPNGDVAICPDFPDYIVGNIHKDSLDQIWYSDNNEKFRKMIMEEKLSICSRCCQYYQF